MTFITGKKNHLKLLFIFLLFPIFFLGCSKEEPEDLPEPTKIVLSASLDSFEANGTDVIIFEVEVYDQDDELMPNMAWDLYVNNEIHGSDSFSTTVKGVYSFKAKVGELESNTLSIKADAVPSTIELAVSSSTLVADGKEEVEFEVIVLDDLEEEIPGVAYQLYINGEKHNSGSFSTDEPGEYTAMAKIGDIESNQVTFNAIGPAELISAIRLSADSQLILANNLSISNLKTEFFDQNGAQLNHNFDYKILVNNEEYSNSKFRTTVSGDHEIVVKLNDITSNKIVITARQEKNYEEIEIPVIFHVVHRGEGIGTGKNIDANSVYEELDKLNKGFSNAYGSVNPNAVDVQVRFRLATVDENGKALQEPGINRINGTIYDKGAPQNDAMNSSFYVPPPVVDVRNKNLFFDEDFDQADIPNDGEFGYEESKALANGNNWNNKLYYNIYIMPIQKNLNASGYAYLPFIMQPGAVEGLYDFPSDAESSIPTYYQGCVLDTESALLDYSETIIHEAGHNLGLYHVFSTDACSTSDYCTDTYSYEKDFYSQACFDNRGSSLRDNFMDYYGITKTFTFEQKERMRSVLEYGFYYRDLKYSDR